MCLLTNGGVLSSFARRNYDSRLVQLGPEKGVIHLATAAVLNAVWDLWARAEGKVGKSQMKLNK